MPTLPNVKYSGGKLIPLYIGFFSGVIHESDQSSNRAFSNYIESTNYHWFVLRVTYNRISLTKEKFKTARQIENLRSYASCGEENLRQTSQQAGVSAPSIYFSFMSRRSISTLTYSRYYTIPYT